MRRGARPNPAKWRVNRRGSALVLAVSLDAALGEPPSGWHPVAWLGRLLSVAERRVGGRGVADGAAAVLAGTVVAGLAAALIEAVAGRLGWAGALLEAIALKPAFAARRLGAAAGEIQAALVAGDLDAARARVGRHLVSRDTRALTGPEVASAAIESVAENLVDSVAAPLMAYAAGGLPAAWVYRALNTADAMWGYRDARYERFGKAAARLDDLANLAPAPLAAGALAAGAALVGERGGDALRVAWAQHGRTASPNAGWPMAAMAGALGVGLEKRGAYRLGDGELPESPGTIGRAVRVFAAASVLVVGAALAVACLGRDQEPV